MKNSTVRLVTQPAVLPTVKAVTDPAYGYGGAAPGSYFLLLESGDRLLLESGDSTLLESA